MSAPVLFEQKGSIGFVTLNSEKTLNALTLDMVELMLAQLTSWQVDDSVQLIFLQGAGEKAFCAGGDVQAMRLSSIENPGGPCVYAETFFEKEYTLDYLLHNYAKPIVVWGHGIVMGGGLGLLAGCSHRVVTERTRLAMPEVTIALFPDVGGSYFLNRMPGHCGRFLALTAASINGPDTIYAGLADSFIASEYKQAAIDGLSALALTGDDELDNAAGAQVLEQFCSQSVAHSPAENLKPHQSVIDSLCDGDNLQVIVERIANLETEDVWLQKAQKGLQGGSPLALKWIFKQLQISQNYSLKEVFASELLLATNIMRHTEFAEGVRALLVDKDQNPQWQFKTLAEVDDAVVDGFFEAPWPENPLASL